MQSFLEKLSKLSPLSREIKTALPEKVIEFKFTKNGEQKVGTCLLSRLEIAKKGKENFVIINEAWDFELPNKKGSYLRSQRNFASEIGKKGSAKFVRTKEWHSKGGKAGGKKSSNRIKKWFRENPEAVEISIKNGIRLGEWNKQNPEWKSEMSKKSWAKDDGTMRNAATRNILRARPLESPRYWEWIHSKSQKRLEASRRGGKTAGNLAVQNGTWNLIRNPSAGGKVGGKIQVKKEWTCPHCSKTGKSNGMKTWHFENCSSNKEGSHISRDKISLWRKENFEILSQAGKKGISKMTKEDRLKGSKKAGLKNVESGHWASLKTKEHQIKASSAANSKKVLCPDGHATSKPSASVYCKKRGLDLSKCVEISIGEYERILAEKKMDKPLNLFQNAKLKRERIFEILPDEFTTKQGSELLFEEFGNVENYFSDKGKYLKIGYGRYKKVYPEKL
jgi:hypothetical protein